MVISAYRTSFAIWRRLFVSITQNSDKSEKFLKVVRLLSFVLQFRVSVTRYSRQKGKLHWDVASKLEFPVCCPVVYYSNFHGPPCSATVGDGHYRFFRCRQLK
uniref:(northern house mosquito) hypothetical protein n=1 Tax=Culex pipiens TaxID=7175 RepID=A0A8D8K2K7_CULPI